LYGVHLWMEAFLINLLRTQQKIYHMLYIISGLKKIVLGFFRFLIYYYRKWDHLYLSKKNPFKFIQDAAIPDLFKSNIILCLCYRISSCLYRFLQLKTVMGNWKLITNWVNIIIHFILYKYILSLITWIFLSGLMSINSLFKYTV
jgi:hypothetical protein